MSGPRERAARLLRWYPRAWRARYGEEFTELLLADLAERPRSVARTADVIRGGLVARLVGLVIMVVGGRHFGNGWPGTGGHPWARTGLVPGGVAAFCWACTLSVSSFWTHPAALAAFPAAELTWMALSPIALASLVAGAATAVRRAELSPALLRFEGRLGIASCVTMAVFLGAGCAWLAARTTPPGSPFRPGAIDVAGLAVMALALGVACQAARLSRRCPV